MTTINQTQAHIRRTGGRRQQEARKASATKFCRALTALAWRAAGQGRRRPAIARDECAAVEASRVGGVPMGGKARKQASLNAEFTERKIKPRSSPRSKLWCFAQIFPVLVRSAITASL